MYLINDTFNAFSGPISHFNKRRLTMTSANVGISELNFVTNRNSNATDESLVVLVTCHVEDFVNIGESLATKARWKIIG